eukprot:TRINITY_DN2394_c0_g2_i1.p1 TRINITY_DN2394_c0_g2~~TRINITY_DN2394_c0_g2_i1.p1  ORF type:complete len:412 (-),score=95.45 TRINITY_DN2394_c0_g2_i1:69-1304(-)
MLSYGNDENTKDGEINMLQVKQIKVGKVDHDENNARYYFTIIHRNKSNSITMAATTEEDRNIWVNALSVSMPYEVGSENILHRVVLGVYTGIRSEPKDIPLIPLDYKRSVVHHIRRPGRAKISLEEYYPSVFADIRRMYGITQEELLEEWNIPEENLVSEGSAGKSGSLFIMSNTRKFMIKSIEKSEKDRLILMIRSYHDHLQNNPESLLMKIIGFYRYRSIPNKSFIMFNNLLLTDASIDEKYDLKGSTKEREASNSEKAKDSPVFLDNDFTAFNRKLFLGDLKDRFLQQVYADAELLAQFDIMDYSILVGIHTNEEYDHPEGREAISFNSDLARNVCHISTPEDAPNEIYFIGIIDNLTHYNTSKKIAHGFKRIKWTKESLSTVPARLYCDRFKDFVTEIVQDEEESTD